MFTGIIQETGTIAELINNGGGLRISIAAPQTAPETHINDSVAINGVCLTVISCTGERFTVEAVEETLAKTTVGKFSPGQLVNLELPVRLVDRLGGHLVQGHVDGLGTVVAVQEKESSRLITVKVPKDFMPFIIPVGSIAIDGVSLTAARVLDESIAVSVIPHTLEKTTLSALKAGDTVNVELDLIGKYVYRMLQGGENARKSNLTATILKEWGYED